MLFTYSVNFQLFQWWKPARADVASSLNIVNLFEIGNIRGTWLWVHQSEAQVISDRVFKFLLITLLCDCEERLQRLFRYMRTLSIVKKYFTIFKFFSVVQIYF